MVILDKNQVKLRLKNTRQMIEMTLVSMHTNGL